MVAPLHVIGLTGGIASGKSTVARMLAERGAAVVDADLLGHEVYAPGTPAWRAIRGAFGEDLVQADGQIDRRRLAALVFTDPDAMKRLTDIVWPAIKAEMVRRLEQLRKVSVRVAVVEAAVLLEAGWEDQVDEIWTVAVAPEVAVQRLTARSGMTDEQARQRMAAQMGNEERTARSTHVIENNGDISELARRVEALWQGVACCAA